MMLFKLNRAQKDNLYWIYPVLFLGLTFIAISNNKNNKETTARSSASVKPDSSITISTKSVIVDSLNTQAFDQDVAVPMAY